MNDYENQQTEMPMHKCPVCGKKIPLQQECCPECEFAFYQLLGLL